MISGLPPSLPHILRTGPWLHMELHSRYWSGQVVCLHDLYDWSLLHQMVFICDPLVPAILKYSFVPTPGWWDITLLRAADGTRPCQTQTEAIRLCIMNISRILAEAVVKFEWHESGQVQYDLGPTSFILVPCPRFHVLVMKSRAEEGGSENRFAFCAKLTGATDE
ncbi:hypothetical protein K466DRAFT_3562 [Polyporus arcularius HHB13444]|uniref:Uncharacterized protein n=1 Tax=Polyporus arcularius HHB13444 TaxID=1314778 RepID=A0A5C3PYU7_9APHY|nr:hypothetical protein K466DRAFT_3562 [Polyporus arcularius HHB13444]